MLPEDQEARRGLLELFLFEKAFYEIGYEAANRPAWLADPGARRARPAPTADGARRAEPRCSTKPQRAPGGPTTGGDRRPRRRPITAIPSRVLGLHDAGRRPAVRARLLAGRRAASRCSTARPASAVARRSSSCIPTGFFAGAGRRPRERFRLPAARSPAAARPGRRRIPTASRRCSASSTSTCWREGSHRRIYERLGAHPTTIDGVDGVAFAVWAPNARRVSVVGDFNHWDGRRHPMRQRIEAGVWEIFVPGVGARRALQVRDRRRRRRAAAAEGRPGRLSRTSSRRRPPRVVAGLPQHDWSDGDWMAARARAPGASPRRSRSTRCHLGSWRAARTATASSPTTSSPTS